MDGLDNIGGLCGFIAAAQHHDHHLAALHIIHAPSRAELLAQLKHACSDRLHIAKLPALDTLKPTRQADTGLLVFNGGKPLVKLWQSAYCNHGSIVSKLIHK